MKNKMIIGMILLGCLTATICFAAKKKTNVKKSESDSSSGLCVDIINLPFTISQKLDNHHYELVAEVDSPYAIHVLLVTKKAVFTTPGHPVGIGVMDAPPQTVHLESGFDSQVRTIVECAIIPYKTHTRIGPSLSFRNEINGQ